MVAHFVRWVILIIIFVFDPLAVLLLIAANIGWEKEREEKIKKIGRSENRIAKGGKLVDAMEMDSDGIKPEKNTRKKKLQKLKEVSLILLISFKFFVASISLCPPDRKATPGTSLGIFFLRHSNVFFAISSALDFCLQLAPGSIMFGLRTVPLRFTLCIASSL